MEETIENIAGVNCHIVAMSENPTAILIKPLGEFERQLLKEECSMIAELSSVPFAMVAFEISEEDLRPGKAEKTFSYLESELLPYVRQHFAPKSIVVGGYSLGGLFALWSATCIDNIDAVFAGSPSLWMDDWDKYASTHPTKARYVYMSLGDKEECTKKKPFCIVGERVRSQHQLHVQQLGESKCTLEWNEGGHFANIEQRKAKGFAWCLNKLK